VERFLLRMQEIQTILRSSRQIRTVMRKLSSEYFEAAHSDDLWRHAATSNVVLYRPKYA